MWNIDADPAYREIPERIMDSMYRWGKEGIVPGGFLTAEVKGDLLGAVSFADNEVVKHLPGIVRFVWNQMPSGCHALGAPSIALTIVEKWRLLHGDTDPTQASAADDFHQPGGGRTNDERPDLKRVLMELGNLLVIEHGWEPGHLVRVMMDDPPRYPEDGSLVDAMFMSSTDVILALMYQLNHNPNMREALNQLGFAYPVREDK